MRPAILKAAVDGEFGAPEEKALTACAVAQRRTGAAIQVHSTAHRPDIVEALTSLDVDPTRIYLAHVDMNTPQPGRDAEPPVAAGSRSRGT